MSPDLEWDETKRQATLTERGLDFADVAFLDWDSANTVVDSRRPYSEARFVTAGLIAGRLCIIAWCYRGQNMRIISLRKANKREERHYEKTRPLHR